MRKRMKWMTAIGVLLILMLAVCSGLAEDKSVTFAAAVSTQGTPPAEAETYTVRMQADGDFPMPAGASDGIYDLSIQGADNSAFPAIRYDRVGIYTYTIRQIAGTQALIYDDTVYEVKVTVSNGANGSLILTPVVRIQGDVTRKKGADVAFTNIYEVEKTSRTVVKNWDDHDNQDGKRPESITAALQADGKPALDINGAEIVVTLNEGNNWSATVDGLDKYLPNSRQEIIYSWTEGPAGDDYQWISTETDKTDSTKTIITNQHVPETVSAGIQKIWDDANNQDGIRPGGTKTLRVWLMAGEDELKAVYLTEKDEWKATVENLPKYANGQEIEYRWTEKKNDYPIGYELTGTVTEKVDGGWLTTLSTG